MASGWYDADTWNGLATWTTIALTPLFVLLSCVLQPDVDVGRTVREQWFYSTYQGPHRILAEWHTVWILLAGVACGVAQFLAWRAPADQWYYPAAMCLFYACVALQWAWIAAYFRLVDRFRTGRALLLLALVADVGLACLYAPLSKTSAALALARALLHDAPMLVIANSAVRIHADPRSPRDRSPRPDRPYVRRAAERDMGSPPPTPPASPPGPQRRPMSVADVVAFIVPPESRPPI